MIHIIIGSYYILRRAGYSGSHRAQSFCLSSYFSGYQRTKSHRPIALAEWQLERIVIVKLGTLVGVHGDRAAAVVWIWRGFASLKRRSSQECEAVDDDCGMVVFQLVLIGPGPIGNVTNHVKRIGGYVCPCVKAVGCWHFGCGNIPARLW